MTPPNPERPDEQLFSLLKRYGRCDLLLDRTLGNPLHEVIATETFEDPPAPLNPAAVQIEPENCLVLLRLGMRNLALLDASVALALEFANANPARGRPVCAWLFGSRVSLQSTAGHLRRQMVVHGQAWSSFLLRFHDPRVLPWLVHILDDAQVQHFINPAAQWVWMDREGALRVLLRSNPGPTGMVDISGAQDMAIGQIELLNQCLATFDRMGRPWPISRDAELVSALLQAVSKGHEERQDQLAYLLHAALVGPRFDAHPDVAHAIVGAGRNGLGLCAALGDFDDRFWEDIRKQMGARRSSTERNGR